MKLSDCRYMAWAAGLAITAALPLVAGFTTFGWEVSEILALADTLAANRSCAS